METFKANLIIFLFIVLIGWLGYWAVNNIQAKNMSISRDNTIDIGPVVTSGPGVDVTTDISDSIATNVKNNQNTDSVDDTKISNNQSLISDLQKLIDDNILMKKGSKGTRVGTIQEFLSVYGISISADNDYGDSTVNAVKKFQTDQKLSADGQTGNGTYKKMIEWLQKN
jgi:murein L,D-transpeptidase YcbB/YkuD